MSTLYNNERAFHFLNVAEQAELEAAQKEGRVMFMGYDLEWYSKPDPNFTNYITYRIVKPELTKPSIDWSHVDDWVTCMTVYPDGVPYHWEYPPSAGNHGWYDGGKYASAIGFKSFRPGTCHWKDSLVMRPKGEK